MIIWSGRGILIVLFAALGFTAGSLAGAAFGSPKWTVVLALAGGAAAMWLFALTVGKTQVTQLMDPATGLPVTLKKRHTLFFLPPKFWSVAGTGVALFSILLPSDFTTHSTSASSAGHAAFNAANGLLTTSSKGVVHGNTAEAQVLAEAFSAALKEIRKEGIEKGRSAGPSLTKGEFLTYCLLKEQCCVFMVHVPQLRKFSEDAKAFMAEAGWLVALQVLEESGTKPAAVAVGVRGSLLYDRVIVGRPGPVAQHKELVIRTVKGNSASVDELAAQFDAALAAKPQPDTKAAPAVKAGAIRAAVEPEEAREEPAAAPPASPEAARGSVESTADETPASISGAEDSATVAEVPPGSGETLSGSTDPAPAPVAPPAAFSEPADAMRTWTDVTGRTMKASFVRFASASKDTAEFKREDGQNFVVPLARFSVPDQNFVKNHPDLQD